jgi:hypothetical protein
MTWGELYSYGNKKSKSNLDFTKKTTFKSVFVSTKNSMDRKPKYFLIVEHQQLDQFHY